MIPMTLQKNRYIYSMCRFYFPLKNNFKYESLPPKNLNRKSQKYTIRLQRRGPTKRRIRSTKRRTKYETKNMQADAQEHTGNYIYFLCGSLLFNFVVNEICASSTTGISIYSGTITGKIVLGLDGSMKDLFFVRLHTLILCPNSGCAKRQGHKT